MCFSGLASGTGQCLLSVLRGCSVCQVCAAAPGFSSAFSKASFLTFMASPQRRPRRVVRLVCLGRCSSEASILTAATARACQEPLSSHLQPAGMFFGSSASSVVPCFKPLPGEAAANALQPAVSAVPVPGGFPVPRAHPCKDLAFSSSEFCPTWFLRLWGSALNKEIWCGQVNLMSPEAGKWNHLLYLVCFGHLMELLGNVTYVAMMGTSTEYRFVCFLNLSWLI